MCPVWTGSTTGGREGGVDVSVTRRAVFERLAATTDARSGRTTTIERVATSLDADVEAVEAHFERLEACELARTDASDRVRITITGEELHALDVYDVIVLSPQAPLDERIEESDSTR